jgi:hypothetical protein
MTEDELVAEFKRLYPDAEKRAAELMDADRTVVDDLTSELITEDELGQPLDPPRVRLSFTASNYADYDNDGAVKIADITPLAQRYGMEYDDAPPPDELLSERTVLDHPDTRHNRLVAGADGSGNGEVEIADITPLAINYNSELVGYNIYRAEVVDSLLTFSEVPLPNLLEGASELTVALTEWAEVEEGQSGLSAGVAGRYVITLETEAPPPGEVFGFRAHAFGDDEEGPKSNVATIGCPSEGDTTPPFWVETVGVTEVIPQANYELEVRWGEARDGESPPVVYRVYYASSDGFSLPTATALEVESECTATLEELEENCLYTVVVRARDSAVPPNEDGNMVSLSAVTTLDITPPEFDRFDELEISAKGEGVMNVRTPSADENESEISYAEIAYRILPERPEPPLWSYLFDEEYELLPETQVITLTREEYAECYSFYGKPVSIEGVGATEFLVVSLQVTNSHNALIAREGDEVATVYAGNLPSSYEVSIGTGILPDESVTVFYICADPDAHCVRAICDADGVIYLLMDKCWSPGDIRFSIRSYTFQGDFLDEWELPVGDLVNLDSTSLRVCEGVATVTFITVAQNYQRIDLGSIVVSSDGVELAVYETENSYPIIPVYSWHEWNPPIVDAAGRILVKAGDDSSYDQVLMLDPATASFENVFPFEEATKDVLLYKDGSAVKLVERTSGPSGPGLREYRLEGEEFVLEATVNTEVILAAAPRLEPGDRFALAPSGERYILTITSGYETEVESSSGDHYMRWHTVFDTLLHSPAPGEFAVWHQSGAEVYYATPYPIENPGDILFGVVSQTGDDPPEWDWVLAHKS